MTNLENGYATRDSFRTACDRRYVTTDELPYFGKVNLQSLTERERRLIQSHSLDEDGVFSHENHAHVFAWMCIYMVLDKPGDEGGEHLFSEKLDLEWLVNVDFAASRALLDAMNDHAEMGPLEPTPETLKKSLTGNPGSDSGSAVPEPRIAGTSTA